MEETEGEEVEVVIYHVKLKIQNLKKIFLLGFYLFLSTYTIAQNIDLEGVITDSNGTPIMGVNIVAVEKETQILDGFGISNEAGFYRLTLKRATDYEIKISFIGLKEVSFVFNEQDNIEKNFVLEEQAESLDEVELVYEMPVTIKGDTIIYNADSFNTGSERKLEDVLKNMQV